MKKLITVLLVFALIIGCTACSSAPSGDIAETSINAYTPTLSPIETSPENSPSETIQDTAQNISLKDDDLVAAAEKDGLWGYIDPMGNWLIQPQFDYAEGFSEGFAYVQSNGIVGYIDKTGNITIQLGSADDILYTKPFSDGYALVSSISKGYYFIDTNGEVVLQGYTSADSFNDGLAPVSKSVDDSGKSINFGFIDKSGKFIIKEQFLNARPFSDGLACVQDENGIYGFINKSGDWAIKPQYEEASSFSEGMALVNVGFDSTNMNPIWAFIDKKNEVMFNEQMFYQYIPMQDYSCFNDGLACVIASGESEHKYINTDGDTVFKLPSEYSYDPLDSFPFKNGYAIVVDTDYNFFVIDTKGTIVAKGFEGIRRTGFNFVNNTGK